MPLENENSSADMDSEIGEDIVKRLKRVEAQLRAIQQLVKRGLVDDEVMRRFAGTRKLLQSTVPPMTRYLVAKELRTVLPTAAVTSADLRKTLDKLENLLQNKG